MKNLGLPSTISSEFESEAASHDSDDDTEALAPTASAVAAKEKEHAGVGFKMHYCNPSIHFLAFKC